MASSSSIRFLLLLFIFFTSSNAKTHTSTIPKHANIIFDLERDPSTLQYTMKINQGTPLSEVKLVVDLGGRLPWFDCHKKYYSSSNRPVSCASFHCSLANKQGNACELRNGTNNACSVHISSPVTRIVCKGELISDLVNVTSNPDSRDPPVASPRRCVFGCASNRCILTGLAKSSNGVAGLGRSSALSLVTQLAVAFRFSRIFALDLHDTNTDGKSGETGGKIYFGGGPYIHYLYGFDDLTERVLTYTPLLINPNRKEEYFVDLKLIKVHGQTIPINQKLLSINKKTGVGGTKVDIQIPYTTLETSIYKEFTKAYTVWAQRFNDDNAQFTDPPNITMVTPVAPFTTCFNSSTVPPVTEFQNSDPPSVAFVFPKSVWNISLFDMVRVNDGIDCVGFVDGGSKPETSIVIGAHQIGFLEFDISRSRLGFEEPNLIDTIQF